MTQPCAGSVLLVDGAPEHRGILTKTLSDLHSAGITAASVAPAKLALEQPDYIHPIVVDSRLPDGSGFEVRPKNSILVISRLEALVH